ncbi:hypothetical protein XAC3810_530024 [Xanthomonas citri pv. citri]|uniref:Uncharacterized protein n=1 Tax=Xanthomonas citri pv. citri TaxID=611301 RepID=A0A0U5FHR2_XANCI|nr:hypothetical protein XAC9322_530023 [Xanthomonas citri pv. citri]CEJ45853.1 hypothetical protein XAB3213_3270020 [Xanthomonas citri pv. bilvae]CEE31571.1 hypothetical protein XAC3824_670024 [Xanthomonas citri pv. citri]CEE32921.1 hypothetical protein XAC1083_520024 [Xanthomonas citri pv. citri]CEE42436.1 hypothetical protein XAC3810_530024 [Xanthomonas citri pv. citri]
MRAGRRPTATIATDRSKRHQRGQRPNRSVTVAPYDQSFTPLHPAGIDRGRAWVDP